MKLKLINITNDELNFLKIKIIGREILTGGGITSMSISASGVFVDTVTEKSFESMEEKKTKVLHVTKTKEEARHYC